MDVKSTFLNWYITKEVYVEQLCKFWISRPRVKFEKALHGLNKFLELGMKIEPNFCWQIYKGKVDTTLFTKTYGNDLLIV